MLISNFDQIYNIILISNINFVHNELMKKCFIHIICKKSYLTLAWPTKDCQI